MLMDTSVRESNLWRVKVGQLAVVEVDAFPVLRLAAQLVAVGVLGRNSRDRVFEEKRYDVQLRIDGTHPELRPDMTARAQVVVAERRGVVTVPPAALAGGAAGWRVMVVHPLKTEVRNVVVGELDDHGAEIVSGLAAGETVAVGWDVRAAGLLP